MSFTFPRQIGITIGIIFFVAASVAGYFYYQDQVDQKKKALVSIKAAYGGISCIDPNFPLSLIIHNASDTALDSVSISVVANRNGFSDNLLSQYLSSDKIMQPNEYYSACWSLSDYKLKALEVPPISLQWKATVSFITWQKK